MQYAIKILLFIIIGIIIFSLLQFFISIFPPKFRSHTTPALLGLAYEDVQFKTKDNIQIAGWLITKNKTKPTIIVGHGYPFDKGNILPHAQFLTSQYNILLFDFRSFGQSEGRITTGGYKETADIHAAVKFLKDKGYKGPIGVLGFSMSASSFIMAEDNQIKAIVAEAPYASFEEVIKDLYWIFPYPLSWPFIELTKTYGQLFLGLDPNAKSPIKSLSTTKTPTLIIHGKKDNQIPIRHATLLKQHASKKVEFWILEDAGHGNAHHLHKRAYEKRVLEFYKKNLK